MNYTTDNFVRSLLAVDATATDATLVVALAAPPFRNPPNATADAPGIMVLQDSASSPTKIEIVTYTGSAISGSQVTLSGVVRAQEGTAAQLWSAGAIVFAGLTAAVLQGKVAAAGATLTLWSGTQAEYNALPSATTSAAGFVAVITP